MDGRGISNKDYRDMMHWFPHEALPPVVEHMKEEGIDQRRHPVEFMTYDHGCQGRIVTNEKGETSLKGLYAIGEELAPGVSNASVSGWICGENAVNYIKNGYRSEVSNMKEQAEQKAALVENILARKDGADWRGVNIALQQIMQDYAGWLRSEALLKAGFAHLTRLKKKTYEIMRAQNQHEVMRCLEVLNLIELGELVFTGALERRETRGDHVRLDYPLANPRMNKQVQIQKNRWGNRSWNGEPKPDRG